ncbi:MAG: hypothetical protein FJX64_10105 [Alphaproteobacteria bacterium]|nr:hypothetical protein [Alphaproteobacteria bacterium]
MGKSQHQAGSDEHDPDCVSCPEPLAAELRHRPTLTRAGKRGSQANPRPSLVRSGADGSPRPTHVRGVPERATGEFDRR